VWSLEPGSRTAPITTERGIYIVQVDSARTDDEGTRELFLRQLVLRLQPSRTTLDSLRTLAFEVHQRAKSNFADAASEHGLTLETLQPLQGGNFIPGFGFSQRLRDWAFAAKPGSVGDPFGNDETVLIPRVVEHRPEGLEPFETVQERVRIAFLEERKKEIARSRLESVRQALDSGTSFTEAARSQDLELKTPEPFTYYESVPDVGGANEFTAVASALAVGEISGVVETSVAAFVLEVLSRDAFDEAAFAEARETHQRTLLDRQINEIVQSWLAELRESAKIEDRRPPRV
jgi:parvulin-like peptidyl-prolyl isomerase